MEQYLKLKMFDNVVLKLVDKNKKLAVQIANFAYIIDEMEKYLYTQTNHGKHSC